MTNIDNAYRKKAKEEVKRANAREAKEKIARLERIISPRALRAIVAQGFVKFGRDLPDQRPMSVVEQVARVQGHVVEEL